MYLLVKLYSVHVTVHYLFEMYICNGLRVHFFLAVSQMFYKSIHLLIYQYQYFDGKKLFMFCLFFKYIQRTHVL